MAICIEKFTETKETQERRLRVARKSNYIFASFGEEFSKQKANLALTKGLTRDKISKTVKRSPSLINAWEAGKAKPSPEQLELLAPLGFKIKPLLKCIDNDLALNLEKKLGDRNKKLTKKKSAPYSKLGLEFSNQFLEIKQTNPDLTAKKIADELKIAPSSITNIMKGRMLPTLDANQYQALSKRGFKKKPLQEIIEEYRQKEFKDKLALKQEMFVEEWDVPYPDLGLYFVKEMERIGMSREDIAAQTELGQPSPIRRIVQGFSLPDFSPKQYKVLKDKGFDVKSLKQIISRYRQQDIQEKHDNLKNEIERLKEADVPYPEYAIEILTQKENKRLTHQELADILGIAKSDITPILKGTRFLKFTPMQFNALQQHGIEIKRLELLVTKYSENELNKDLEQRRKQLQENDAPYQNHALEFFRQKAIQDINVKDIVEKMRISTRTLNNIMYGNSIFSFSPTEVKALEALDLNVSLLKKAAKLDLNPSLPSNIPHNASRHGPQ